VAKAEFTLDIRGIDEVKAHLSGLEEKLRQREEEVRVLGEALEKIVCLQPDEPDERDFHNPRRFFQSLGFWRASQIAQEALAATEQKEEEDEE
jgi:hypothetical protein